MTPRGSRGWTLGLVALALLFPAGALLAPWMWPSRSRMPAVPLQLDAPIVLVTVAGLRPDEIGPRAEGPSRTPRLDRLAEEGVTLLGACAASNQLAASAAALMTGRCPRELGVRKPGDRLAPDAETLAERCAAAGYLTAAVVADRELIGAGLEQGFGTWDERPDTDPHAVVDAGLARVRAATDRPWLLWLDFAELPAGDEAALASLDAALGRLLDALAADGRLETATLAVIGLRGQRPGEASRGATHADLTEAVIRVPLLLRLPGRQARGLVLERLAQGIDIAPTLAGWWLREAWTAPTGRSLQPAIVARRVVDRVTVTDGWLAERGGAVAVRYAAHGGPAKLVLADSGEPLGLYSLAQDPREQQPATIDAAALAFLRASWAGDGVQPGCLPPAP